MIAWEVRPGVTHGVTRGLTGIKGRKGNRNEFSALLFGFVVYIEDIACSPPAYWRIPAVSAETTGVHDGEERATCSENSPFSLPTRIPVTGWFTVSRLKLDFMRYSARRRVSVTRDDLT